MRWKPVYCGCICNAWTVSDSWCTRNLLLSEWRTNNCNCHSLISINGNSVFTLLRAQTSVPFSFHTSPRTPTRTSVGFPFKTYLELDKSHDSYCFHPAYHLFFPALSLSCGMWDLLIVLWPGSNLGPCTGSAVSEPLNHQGSPPAYHLLPVLLRSPHWSPVPAVLQSLLYKSDLCKTN